MDRQKLHLFYASLGNDIRPAASEDVMFVASYELHGPRASKTGTTKPRSSPRAKVLDPVGYILISLMKGTS